MPILHMFKISKITQVIEKCKAEGNSDGRFHYIPLDMSDEDSPRKLIEVGFVML